MLTIVSFYIPRYGQDLREFYIPFAQGCNDCGFNPYYSRWFFVPLSIIPNNEFAMPIWSFMVFCMMFWLIYKMEVTPLVIMSFSMIAQYSLGQVDIFLCIGLYLMLKSKNPWVQGLGICFLAIKPQVTALVIVGFLIGQKWSQLWKIVIPPAMMLLLSFLVFGIDWPVRWLTNAQTLPLHVWRLASSDTWPFALPFIWIPFLFEDRERRVLLSILMMALVSPAFGTYTYIVFILFYPKWWTIVLSYAWLVFLPFDTLYTLRWAWILPLVMIIHICYTNWDESWWMRRRAKLANQTLA
ncbi:glycosyltransferase 87 family protein [Herpetosiphon llansteffanensis]|uniref:glycosyltransferase 87 family protein n=1 Tax=Herpetosiphon llansteffanensis TaxID=2094568 RepID=UPI0030B85C74